MRASCGLKWENKMYTLKGSINCFPTVCLGQGQTGSVVNGVILPVMPVW